MKKILKRFSLLLCSLFFLAQAPVVSASDIVEVLPLTDQILLVHFDDGNVIYHKLGESRNSDVLVSDPLNLADAMAAASYTLSSTDDINYTAVKNPSQVGRKSKGTDYLMQGPRTTGRADEHWVYLHLPSKMQTGKNYTLSTGTLAKNGNSFTFTYNEKNLRSEAVKVNQAGYIPSAKTKMGYVYHWMGDKGGLQLTAYAGKDFWITDYTSGEVKFTGQLTFRAAADNPETGQAETPNYNFLNAEVYECDFSDFSTPGKYRLAVEGIGCSFPFEIKEDIYRASFKTTARGLYHNRSGIELTTEFTEHRRPAPHNPNLTPGFQNRLRYSTTRSCDTESDGGNASAIRALVGSGDKGLINTWGWYQDAGDWDGYPTHLRIPVLLLLAYEMAPEKFTDGELNIPGKNNGIPDILDEARWLIEYLHRTRHAIMDAGYGTGGVSGRVCGDYWGDDVPDSSSPNGSWGDVRRTWYVFGEDPMNTYMYAGLASHYAYLLSLSNKTCPTGINWLQEATLAYNWAKENTREGDENAPHAVTSLNDARMYAAANLYKLTGKNEYHARFIKDSENIGSGTELIDESTDTRFGVYSYLLLNKIDNTRTVAGAVERFKGATTATANIMVNGAAERRSCRWGGHFYMPMLVGQATTPWVIDGLMDYYINNKETSLTNVITTLDYFMGINPLNHIWFTGETEDIANPERRHVRGAFHLDSWYNIDKADREVPGFAPYGPWRQEINISAGGGWWTNEYPYASAYPPIKNEFLPLDNSSTAWPGHELWFDYRYSPSSGENTVHQNTVHWAIATGLLCADVVANPFDANRLPAAEAFEAIVEELEPEGDAFLIADFETKILYPNGGSIPDGCFGYLGGDLFEHPVDNPDKSGINTSEKALKHTKAGDWKLLGLETKGKALLDIADYAKFRFKVMGNVNRMYIQIFDANQPDGTPNIFESNEPFSVEGEWKVFTLDISGKTGMFSNINIFPNPMNSSGANEEFYFDDFELISNIEASANETPVAPQNLSALEAADETAVLSWNAVTNTAIEKYEVYRFIVGEETEFSKLTETTATSLQLTGLDLSKAYVFTVKAISEEGFVSAFSSPLRIPIAPNAPEDLRALENAGNTATLLWDAVTNTTIAKYEVYRRIVGEETGFSKLTETTATSLQLTGLDPLKTYMFSVKTISEKGLVSAFSDSLRVPVIPSVPANLRLLEDTGNDLVLTWDAVTNTSIVKYEIHRRVIGESNTLEKFDETEDLSYKLTGLYASNIYLFAVRAVSIKGLVSPASSSLRVEPTISVDDAEVTDILIYPNPVASGELVYVSGLTDGVAYTASIFDSVGNELGRQPVASNGAVQVNLNAGIYFIRITSPSTLAQTITIAVY